MNRKDACALVAIETLVRTGTLVVLEQARDAIMSALYIIAATELEAANLKETASTDKRRDHWQGRQDGAWSIRRHADKLEAALAALYKVAPMEDSPRGRGYKKDLTAILRKVKTRHTKELNKIADKVKA